MIPNNPLLIYTNANTRTQHQQQSISRAASAASLSVSSSVLVSSRRKPQPTVHGIIIANMVHVAVKVLVVLSILLLLSNNDIVRVDAFPTGVGSCIAGKDSIGGIHTLRDTIIATDLPTLGVSVVVGSSSYQPGSNIPLLPGVEYGISVNTADPAFFRGVFIRFEALDGQNMIGTVAARKNTILTPRCLLPYVIGLSHTNSTIKNTATGRFRTDVPGRIKMDISVVAGNEPNLSLYGHSEYIVDVVSVGFPLSPTTFAPISVPVATIATVVIPPTLSTTTTPVTSVIAPILVSPPAPAPAPAPTPAVATTTTTTTGVMAPVLAYQWLNGSPNTSNGVDDTDVSRAGRYSNFQQDSSGSTSSSNNASRNKNFANLGESDF